jgi:cytochrome c2
LKTSVLSGVLEPVAISIGLTLVVSHRFFEPIWEVASGLLALGVLTGLAYLAGYVAYRASGRGGLGRAVTIAAAATGPVLLPLLALDLEVSRYILALELALLWGFLGLAASKLPQWLRLGVSVGFAGVAAYPTLAGLTTLGETSTSLSSDDVAYVFSSYHDLRITTIPVMEGDLQYGGALTSIPGGRVLVVAGSGDARILTLADGAEVSTVDLNLPIDVPGYYREVPNPTWFYRVTDVLYDAGSLLATYTHRDSERDCYTVRLVEAPFDGSVVGPWTTRFESRPCVEVDPLNNESAGRIAALGPTHVLVTMGNFGKMWDDQADYSKILRLDRQTWRAEIFTRGHRNPQGLLVTSSGIWSTEHGPHGGDELNRIEPGRDYGWPSVSYGTAYGQKTLSTGGTPGDHAGFAAPVYSWTPSVGISNLIEVSGDALPLWKGDLLIGSLTGLGNGEALHRVRILEGRAVNVERIPTGRPVRDLLELDDGAIVLWDGRGVIQLVRSADLVFAQCAGCHNVRRSTHGIGPDLAGVVGSPTARHANYQYSEAMRRYGGRWTPARLDRYIRSPQEEIPGTTMEHAGVADPAARAEIIQFLREVSGGAVPLN